MVEHGLCLNLMSYTVVSYLKIPELQRQEMSQLMGPLTRSQSRQQYRPVF